MNLYELFILGINVSMYILYGHINVLMAFQELNTCMHLACMYV